MFGCSKFNGRQEEVSISPQDNITNSPVGHKSESTELETDKSLGSDLSNTYEPFVINELSNDKEGTFYLGQPYDEVSAIIDKCGMVILSATDKSIDVGKFGFGFEHGILCGLQVDISSELSTIKGLCFGDSYNKMIELYSEDYNSLILCPEATIYEYYMEDHYFHVRIFNDEVNLWGISIESALTSYN